MIRIILIDIDNTIYSKETGLQNTIIKRAKSFIKNITNFETQEIDSLANQLYTQYGTILSGLIQEYRIDPEEFIKFVFDVEICDFLIEDLQVKEVLTKLPGRKFVFSNSPKEYIEKILHCLGIYDCFDGVFDRRYFDYGSKSEPVVYRKVINYLNVSPMDCVLVDDKLANILIAKKLGFKTIWINENGLQDISNADFVISKFVDIDKILLFDNS